MMQSLVQAIDGGAITTRQAGEVRAEHGDALCDQRQQCDAENG